jgi:hypothetical protein
VLLIIKLLAQLLHIFKNSDSGFHGHNRQTFKLKSVFTIPNSPEKLPHSVILTITHSKHSELQKNTDGTTVCLSYLLDNHSHYFWQSVPNTVCHNAKTNEKSKQQSQESNAIKIQISTSDSAIRQVKPLTMELEDMAV